LDTSLHLKRIAAAIEWRAVEMSLEWRFPIGGEIDETAFLIYGFDGALTGISNDHPVS
jgi:hypothetical protein